MNTSDLEKAFTLSAALIEHPSYHSMTHMFMEFLRNLEGVLDVASYEIFGDAAKRSGQALDANDFLIRRFPLSLDDQYQDENFEMLERMLDAHDGGVHYLVEKSGPWMALDVSKSVKPRRIVLIKGTLSDYDTTLVSGLFGVYANQVSLLDSKERDELTHLPNRHSFDMQLNHVVSYYQKLPEQMDEKTSWLAVLNVDNINPLNDENGHVFGDEVLLLFSSLMGKVFRYSDFLFRFGGDEFAIILNQTNLAGAKFALERFGRRVEEYQFPSGKISTSIGFTMIVPSTPPAQLIEQADIALNESKASGRRTVMLFKSNSEQIKKHKDDARLL